jgi:membrane-anchored mycosin MYCP
VTVTAVDQASADPPWDELGDPPYRTTDDLIVGLPHLDRVVNELRESGVVLGPPEPSDLLGLARLPLPDVGRAAHQVLERIDAGGEPRLIIAGHVRPTLPLDQVLWGLRGLFAADNAGWTPVLGKNRVVGRLHGVGEVSHGGAGDPQPVTRAAKLPPRGDGPGRGVRVGVLDTGLSPHPWLAGGWAALYRDVDSDDSVGFFPEGHATFVTGLVLSQAPGALVEVHRVLNGGGTGDSWEVAQEMVRVGRSGVAVLNLSFLCFTEDGQAPMVLATAVDRVDPHVVVVAAAGNYANLRDADGLTRTDDQIRKPAWPAALDDVIAVGASQPDGEPAEFSPAAPWVDLRAPGVNLLSTYLPQARGAQATPVQYVGSLARWGGTSFAAALVSGAIAAGTQPGRVSSRTAVLDILRGAQEDAARTGTKPTAHPHPPHLNLRTF